MFSPIQREIHQIAMDLDRPAALAPGHEEEASPASLVSPANFHTLAPPLRLGAPPSLEETPECAEQQHDSAAKLAQIREADMRMQLD